MKFNKKTLHWVVYQSKTNAGQNVLGLEVFEPVTVPYSIEN